ncbi:MAG: glycogen debranching protein GlgX [Candidatus Nanopelagicales bacterium]
MTHVVPPKVAWPGTWEPLGVTADDGGVNVAIWAEGAERVEFCLIGDDGTEDRVELGESTFHVFHGYVPGIKVGARYGFRVHGPWDPSNGLRFNADKLLLDPYARAIDGHVELGPAIYGHVGLDDLARSDVDSAGSVPLSVVVRDDFDWEGDHPLRTKWSDTVIYEMHVKGFTKQHPDVPEELRGTYAGLAQPAAIEHLQRLGVSAVELLPVHHFIDESFLLERGFTNYWGYNSIGYFAPHGAYSAAGTRGGQVREFKEMVKALHDAGIEVILDVVYNHTAEGNQLGPTLSFRGIANRPYYKLGADDARYYADYTGCGNTLDASSPKVLQLVMDSLRYWVEEMHVDGFRFDLASALARSFHDVDMLSAFLTTMSQDPVLRKVKLIAEPWDIGSGGYQVGEFPPLWTEWNDKYRDCLRDWWRSEAGVGELGWRMSGSADLYSSEGRRPYSSINFVTAHDGYTLRDLVTYQEKHNEANGEDNRDGNDHNRSWNSGVEGETDDPAIVELRRRRIRDLLTTLLLASGTPMLVAGDEMGRTQRGNNNAYCQDSDISWIDWDLDEWQRELFEFTRTLLTIRREHRVFKQRYFFNGEPVREGGPEDLAWFAPDGQLATGEVWSDGNTRAIGMYLAGNLRSRTADGRPQHDSSFLLLLNAGHEAVDFTLPGQPYGQLYRSILSTSDAIPVLAHAENHEGEIVTLPAFGANLLEVTKH